MLESLFIKICIFTKNLNITTPTLSLGVKWRPLLGSLTYISKQKKMQKWYIIVRVVVIVID